MNAVHANPLTAAALVEALRRMGAEARQAPHYIRLSREQANDLLHDSPTIAPTVLGLPLVIADSISDIERQARGQVFWQFGWRG